MISHEEIFFRLSGEENIFFKSDHIEHQLYSITGQNQTLQKYIIYQKQTYFLGNFSATPPSPHSEYEMAAF